MVRIERANLYNLIQDQLRRSFPAPIHTSPEPSPLIPCTHGPVEMPILMDVLRYCRNVRPTWVKFDSKDTKESEFRFEVLSTKSKKRT